MRSGAYAFEGDRKLTRYRIDKTATAARIELTEVHGTHQQLLEAFQECAEGRCSCPTTEYAKVASMHVESDSKGIDIWLESKPGTEFDTSQIANCLTYTVASVEGRPGRQIPDAPGDIPP